MPNVETKVICDHHKCSGEADVSLCSSHYDDAIEEARLKGWEECKESMAEIT